MVCCFLFIALFIFVLVITWCMYYRDNELYFGGGLIPLFMYHHLCLYFLLSLWYVFLHFFSFFFSSLLCFVCLFLYSHMPLVFLLPICVCFIHTWMKTLGGVHMHFIICSHMWILKCVYLTYFIIFDVISQDSNVKHVIF